MRATNHILSDPPNPRCPKVQPASRAFRQRWISRLNQRMTFLDGKTGVLFETLGDNAPVLSAVDPRRKACGFSTHL